MTCKCEEKEKTIFLPQVADVVSSKKMTASETHLTLKLADGSELAYEPGQIVEAGIFGYGEIPLGLSSSPTQTGTFELVVRNVGKVSGALSELEKGEQLTVRGPLGRGFPLKEFRGKDVLIVAGGIGLCPTRSMIRYIMDRRNEFNSFTLFFGCRSPSELLFEEDLAYWRCSKDLSYFETVDKPDSKWKGNVGVITTLFDKAPELSPDTYAIVCGPPVMYKFVIRELNKRNISDHHIFVDLERRMKCGIGKCGHCQFNDRYVCMDGPVFRLSDIKFLEEAI